MTEETKKKKTGVSAFKDYSSDELLSANTARNILGTLLTYYGYRSVSSVLKAIRADATAIPESLAQLDAWLATWVAEKKHREDQAKRELKEQEDKLFEEASNMLFRDLTKAHIAVLKKRKAI